MFDQVHEMVTTGKVEWRRRASWRCLPACTNIPARVKCAILAWHAVMAALKGDSQPVIDGNGAESEPANQR